MIDLYTWDTPNGQKIHIMLEETALEYRVFPVDIGAGEQLRPEYLALNPNNKIPTIVDHDGPDVDSLTVFESGAILHYLAHKTRQLMPSDSRGRNEVRQWLFFQVGHVGPMLGQAGHFLHNAPEPVPYAVERYVDEAERLYRVVDRRLADRDFLADSYSIADIACFPWMRFHQRFQVDIADYPNVAHWLDTINARPAVQRGLAVMQG